MTFAVSFNCRNVRFSSNRLLSNEAFILQVVAKYEVALWGNPWNRPYAGIMNHLPSIYRDNKEVVLRCAESNGLVLKVCSERLRDDSNIVLAAILYNSLAMIYASDTLKDDKRFVLTLVHYRGDILPYVSTRLQNDTQVAAVAVSNWNVHCWSALQPSMQKNFNVAFAYVSNNEVDKRTVWDSRMPPSVPLDHLIGELRNDRQIILAAISKDPRNFCNVKTELRKDPEVILKTVQSIVSYCECLEVVNPKGYEADMVGLIDCIDELHGLYEDLEGKKLTNGSIQKSRNRHKSKIGRRSTGLDSASNDKLEVWLRSQWERVWLVSKIEPRFEEGESGKDYDWTNIQKLIISYIGPDQIPVRYKKIQKYEKRHNILSLICSTVRNRSSGDQSLVRRFVVEEFISQLFLFVTAFFRVAFSAIMGKEI